MKEKFIIEITDNHYNKCYFNGIYANRSLITISVNYIVKNYR